MRPDPGDIPTSLGQLDLVAALSIARDLPFEALELAAERPQRIAPQVLDAMARAAAGETLSDSDLNLVFWGLHALAEAREPRLLPALLRLLRLSDETLEMLLGDAITETLPRIVIALYAGDWPALRAELLDRATNDIARWQMMLAAARLAAEGRIVRAEFRDLLVSIDDDRALGSSDHGWYGWEGAIALLGLSDLAPRVEAARQDGRLLEDLSGPEDFAAILEAAEAAPDDLTRFDELGLVAFANAVDELDALLGLSDEKPEPDEPVRNPLRDVGRNDPCPCGSGRKFKKCCLQAA